MSTNNTATYLQGYGFTPKQIGEMMRLQDEQIQDLNAAQAVQTDPVAAIVPAQDRKPLDPEDIAGEEWEYMQMQEEQEVSFYAGINHRHYLDDHEYGEL